MGGSHMELLELLKLLEFLDTPNLPRFLELLGPLELLQNLGQSFWGS